MTARKLGDLLPPAGSVEDIAFTFWPRFGAMELNADAAPSSPLVSVDAGSPEVIICLKTRDGRKRFILIEVKLRTGKSASPALSDAKISDQLAKYWKHLQKIAEYEGGTPLAVVYVTPWSFPQEDIAESRGELRAKIGEMHVPIFWVSWRDFVSAVRRNAERSQRALPPIIRDVCELMENGWGLVRTEIKSWPTAGALPYSGIFSIEWQWANLRPVGSTWAERPFIFTFEPPLSTCVDNRGTGWEFTNREGNQNGG